MSETLTGAGLVALPILFNVGFLRLADRCGATSAVNPPARQPAGEVAPDELLEPQDVLPVDADELLAGRRVHARAHCTHQPLARAPRQAGPSCEAVHSSEQALSPTLLGTNDTW
jgi:hypothetical protein